MCTSNDYFLYYYKIYQNIWIILAGADVNNISNAKFKKIQFFNIVEVRPAKSKVIIIVITSIKSYINENQ